MLFRLILFFVLNFGALAIGGLLMGSPVENDWYQNVNKAPFTPPGWVFGFAWTTIMICFSFYMLLKTKETDHRRKWLVLFSAQWILNVIWNPVFFKFHYVLVGQFILIALTICVGIFLWNSITKKKTLESFLVLPYFVWLIVANGLNGYIYFFN